MDEPQITSDAGAWASAPSARRDARAQVEIIATLRSAFATRAVVLKDLTRFGARIEGVDGLDIDEAVNLALPGCRPAMAFVAWAGLHGTGLEFAEPLEPAVYDALVERHGLGRQNDPAPGFRPIA